MSVMFVVSISGVFNKKTGFSYTVKNQDGATVGTASIPQSAYSVMSPISLNALQVLAPVLNSSDDSLSQTQQMGFEYYKQMLIKKITIRATWIYPVGTKKVHSIVLDSGKMKSTGSVF